MAKMTDAEARYMAPLTASIRNNILSLAARIERREIKDWHNSEFAIVAATARQLSDDATLVTNGLETIRDIQNGELER